MGQGQNSLDNFQVFNINDMSGDLFAIEHFIMFIDHVHIQQLSWSTPHYCYFVHVEACISGSRTTLSLLHAAHVCTLRRSAHIISPTVQQGGVDRLSSITTVDKTNLMIQLGTSL